MEKLYDLLTQATLKAWGDVEDFNLGGLKVGIDFIPNGQLIGQLLHLAIPKHLSDLTDGVFRKGEESRNELDIVCTNDILNSLEIKTSSSKSGIYGNRSYTQENQSNKKTKAAYYLLVNYERMTASKKGYIRLIRFGYLTPEDWKGQKAASGQQSRLTSNHLITLYEHQM